MEETSEQRRPQAGEASFDDFAEGYDEALNKGIRLSGEGKDYFARGRLVHLRRLLGEGWKAAKALDFGCGTGSAIPHVFEVLEVGELLGLDPSLRSLERARSLWGGYSASFDTTDRKPLCDVDLAFCNGVFHHIPPNERDEAVRVVLSHLRPGGIFAFFENNPWNPGTRYAMSRVPFDADAVLVWPGEAGRLLRSNGFEVLRTEFLFFFPRFLAALRPLERRLAKVPMGGQYLVLCRKPE